MINTLVDDYFQNPSIDRLEVVKKIDMQSIHYDVGKDYFNRNKKLKFAGFSMDEIKSIYDIYEMIHPGDIEKVIQWTRKAMDYGNSHMDFKAGLETKLVFRVIGKNRKIYFINRHSIVNRIDSNGKLATNVTTLHDVTWMKPSNLGIGKLIGIGSELFDYDLPELTSFKGKLTDREIGILKLVAKGFQSPDISSLLNISRHTVTTHRKNMLRKLEVANTPELITMARDMGLI